MTKKMKDSGIEWVGEIPEEWHTTRLKWLSSIKTGTTPSRSNYDIFYSSEDGIKWIKAEDLGNNIDITKTEEYLTKKGVKAGRIFPRNSVYVCCIASVGKVGFCSSESSCNQQINVLPFENAYWKYGYYLTSAQENEYLLQASGNVVKILNTERQKNIICPLPSLYEQTKIAYHLDSKCSQIDSILTSLQDQIDTLEQYKKSIITEAVTKGLNSDVEMKDSGVEWIGEISPYSTVIRLKHFSYLKGRIGWQGLKANDFIDEGPYCVTGTDFTNGKVNWDTCYHVSEKRYSMDSNIHIKVGDLLMTKDGTIGKLAIINELPDKACLNSHLLIIRPLKNKFLNKYLYYVMQSHIFIKYYSLVSSGSTMNSLSQEKTGEFSFPIYEINKQEQIVDYLNKKCSQIDSIISDKKKQLETLEQYKKSLIYEYVTGKKEVA